MSRVITVFDRETSTFVRNGPDGVETIWLDDNDPNGPWPLAVEPPDGSSLHYAYTCLRTVLAPSTDEIEYISRRVRWATHQDDDWDGLTEPTRNVYRRDVVASLHAQAQRLLNSVGRVPEMFSSISGPPVNSSQRSRGDADRSVYRHGTDWREILIEDGTDGRVFAKITDQRAGEYESITLPPDERREAAQALAGPDYRVVPRDLTVGDLAQIARDAGVQLDMDLQIDGEPDRPEPVDPASVKVGDYVSIEPLYDEDGLPNWRVDGWVTIVYLDGLITIPVFGSAVGIDPARTTVRVLHAAEPEPDEAAVDALERAFSSEGIYLSRETKCKLIRDHDVRVVSTDG